MANPYQALVVEDETSIRNLTERALKRAGFHCQTAADGAEAQRLLAHTRFDAIVTDLRMPGVHGHKLIVEILKEPNPPVIVVLTAVAEERIVHDLLLRGVDDIMYKPVTYALLGAKVKALAERRKQQPAGGNAASPDAARSAVREQIRDASETLRSELKSVTQSFESTIKDLEKQQRELEDGFLGSVRVLSHLINQVGQFKGSHAARVEDFASRLGAAMGLQKESLRNLRIAALLHDIGQFGMPDAVRRKPPWLLSPEEREIYVHYPSIGAALLSEVPGAEEVVEIIEAHTEHYDGTGFPQRLQKEAIPLSARIIRLADGFDTHLSYGEEEDPWRSARQHILTNKGSIYDPRLTDRALRFLGDLQQRVSDDNIETISSLELTVGQVLAQNIYDEDGRFLVRKGAAVSVSMLSRLQRLTAAQDIQVYKRQDAPAEAV